jgi:arginine exporter protein ArgO
MLLKIIFMELLQSFVFGITIAIAIGPIALLIINYGLNCGFRVAALSGTGAALADFTYSLIAFTAGSGIAVLLSGHEQQIQLIASLILITFGGWMLYSAYKKRKQQLNNSHGAKCRQPLLSTYALTIINPLTIILFVGLAGSLSIKGLPSILLNATGVLAGSLLIQLALAFFGNVLKTFFKNQKTVFALNLVSAISIIVLGISKMV